MIEEIESKVKEVLDFSSQDSGEIEKFRIEFFGKKGHINKYFSEFKKVDVSKKKDFGKAINKLKSVANNKLEELKKSVKKKSINSSENIDLTRPAEMIDLGSRHPISIIRDKIIDIFYKIGFNTSEGPEI